jgi:DNA repair and recombination protein RAD52
MPYIKKDSKIYLPGQMQKHIMFSVQQKRELRGKLWKKHVKGRELGNIILSYIEGWHAIDEANRIFGFDMWTRETVEIKCVHETGYQRKGYDNKPDKDMWKVSYIAKVRVRVGDVVREGFGAGHGFSEPNNAGDAHESALKEAETDAMKRALMTFGNKFGLALYDKGQDNVSEKQPVALPNGYTKQALTNELKSFHDGLRDCGTKEQLVKLLDEYDGVLKSCEEAAETNRYFMSWWYGYDGQDGLEQEIEKQKQILT